MKGKVIYKTSGIALKHISGKYSHKALIFTPLYFKDLEVVDHQKIGAI